MEYFGSTIAFAKKSFRKTDSLELSDGSFSP